MSEILVQDIVFAVLFSVVLVFNIAGNSLVIHIITNQRGMKTSTNYLLLNLAVSDLIFGVFLAPEHIFLPFFRDYVPNRVLGDWLCKLLLNGNIAWMASRASIFTMICLSVERYFAVCRPHTFSQRFSLKIVKVLVLVSWIYAVFLTLPLLVYTHLNGRGYFFCDITDIKFLKSESLFLLIESACFLILMVFFLIKICISLWCKQTVEPTGQREITERKKKKKVTLCVLAVVVTFVVCWIPYYVSYTIMIFIPTIPLTSFILTSSINAALDPYMFSFQSSRFKALLQKILMARNHGQ